MPDSTKTIEVSCVVAGTLWVASVLTFAAGVLLMAAMDGYDAGASTLAASVLMCGAACVASVSVMLRRHYRAMTNAFNLGREAGRLEAVPMQRVP